MLKRIIPGLILLLLLVACGQEPTPSPLTPTATLLPPETVTPTFTASPLPPSETPTLAFTNTPTPTLTPTPAVYGPLNMPADVNPLTGLVVADPTILDHRPLAFKINIVPRYSNRPPWGLSLADIVFDYYHNDGYTRLHAIFYGNEASLIGPIRSGRMPDHDLVRMYQSIFAYGSADALVNQRLLNAEYSYRLILEGNRSNCPPTAAYPLCRYEPAGVDLLLGSTQAIREYAKARGIDDVRQNLNGMTFDARPPIGGVPGISLYVRYSGDNYARWDYDSLSGRYLRFQDNAYDTGQGEEYAPLIDRLNNQQVAADNVVIVIVRHEYYQRPPNEIVEILLSGSGKAYVFRDGQMFQVLWNRPSLNSVLYLTYPDGTPFPFRPGTTWFQLMGETSLVKEESSGVWRFTFGFP